MAERQGDQVFYLSGDPLGSVSLVTDGEGNAVSQGRYGPFGEGRWGSGVQCLGSG